MHAWLAYICQFPIHHPFNSWLDERKTSVCTHTILFLIFLVGSQIYVVGGTISTNWKTYVVNDDMHDGVFCFA